MSLFSLDDARVLLPQVQELTRQAVLEVEAITEQAERVKPGGEEQRELAETAKQVVQTWAETVIGLGAEVKGLWLVDFDAGDGYWCWKHPEPSLEYFHSYDAGFSGRELIEPEVVH